MAKSEATINVAPFPDAHSEGGALQTAKDLFSGAVGGIAQVLIGNFFLPSFSPCISSSPPFPIILTENRPTLRHSKSPPANLHRLPLRPLRRDFHLPPRGRPGLLQGHPHPAPRNRRLRLHPVRRLPRRPPLPRAAQRLPRQVLHPRRIPTKLRAVLRGRRLRRRCQQYHLRPHRARPHPPADATPRRRPPLLWPLGLRA